LAEHTYQHRAQQVDELLTGGTPARAQEVAL
jgi:hypothetical protein